jgi:hypothetical protein
MATWLGAASACCSGNVSSFFSGAFLLLSSSAVISFDSTIEDSLFGLIFCEWNEE